MYRTVLTELRRAKLNLKFVKSITYLTLNIFEELPNLRTFEEVEKF